MHRPRQTSYLEVSSDNLKTIRRNTMSPAQRSARSGDNRSLCPLFWKITLFLALYWRCYHLPLMTQFSNGSLQCQTRVKSTGSSFEAHFIKLVLFWRINSFSHKLVKKVISIGLFVLVPFLQIQMDFQTNPDP